MTGCKKELVKIGRIIFELGLVGSHSGNLSCRREKDIFITATGTMLGWLTEDDIVNFRIDDDTPHPKASSEYLTHWEIYKKTDYNYVFHGHPPFAVTLSLIKNEIIPIDVEGKYYFDRIPVVEVKRAIGSQELADKVTRTILDGAQMVVVKGHGIFVAAKTVDEGINLMSVSESSSKIVYYRELIGQKK